MSDEDARTVWVGNLDPGYVTEEILYELFLQAGPLQFVRHAKDRTTGEKKTFAFVCYRSESAVPYAIRLFDGTRLFGRPMKAKNRELEEVQRKQGRNGQQMGEGIHTLCPAETQYQQPHDHRSPQSHRGNRLMDPMQQQMNMVITAAGLMGNNPHLGGGGMMPSQGYQQSHMNPSPNRNNRNNGRNYGGGGSSRYLDNDSMKNIKQQFNNSSNNFDNHQQGSNFNFNRLGSKVQDALGGPVGNGNDYNRGRQNDSYGRNIQDVLGGPVGNGNDYNRGRQNDSYGRNIQDVLGGPVGNGNDYNRGRQNDYRNNGKSPDGRRDDQRGNYNRHDNRYDNNRAGEASPEEKQIEKHMRFSCNDSQFVSYREFQKDFRIIDHANRSGQSNEENLMINTNKKGNIEENSNKRQGEKKHKKSKKRKHSRKRSEEKVKDFKWKDTIYKLVKAVPDGLRISKLKKKVIAKYFASYVKRTHKTEEEVSGLFNNKLKKCKKCVVVGERVRISKDN